MIPFFLGLILGLSGEPCASDMSGSKSHALFFISCFPAWLLIMDTGCDYMASYFRLLSIIPAPAII